ncbi:hypothetical protein SKAU_G00300720 [Synaphobranchus kaupii]|uniref:Uncharacterized protein n=1 Tax=Synaphobranchus kaupii TaxID=118154 RepID=A0A9Q1EVL3_SYNKA|nr:hypothetical protein SKAU_G00300720 [Synaphobranchus kaupii]
MASAALPEKRGRDRAVTFHALPGDPCFPALPWGVLRISGAWDGPPFSGIVSSRFQRGRGEVAVPTPLALSRARALRRTRLSGAGPGMHTTGSAGEMELSDWALPPPITTTPTSLWAAPSPLTAAAPWMPRPPARTEPMGEACQ